VDTFFMGRLIGRVKKLHELGGSEKGIGHENLRYIELVL
jgi:hypothetical protein